MIEFVFSATPETIRSEPPEFCSFTQSATADLAVCASMNPDIFAFSLKGKALSCCRSAELLGRYEVLVPALHSEHVADHLPGNRQRGPVRNSLLQLSGSDHGEFMALQRCQFGCLHQHSAPQPGVEASQTLLMPPSPSFDSMQYCPISSPAANCTAPVTAESGFPSAITTTGCCRNPPMRSSHERASASPVPLPPHSVQRDTQRVGGLLIG
jgi:hypothetical protein